jgi:hypothetical protein
VREQSVHGIHSVSAMVLASVIINACRITVVTVTEDIVADSVTQLDDSHVRCSSFEPVHEFGFRRFGSEPSE